MEFDLETLENIIKVTFLGAKIAKIDFESLEEHDSNFVGGKEKIEAFQEKQKGP